MTKLFASALALTIGATGVWAESHGNSEMAEDQDAMATSENQMADNGMGDPANLIRTRDITGGNVYTANAADDEGWSNNELHSEASADWNDIGEIEDIVLSQDGQMKGIVAEVGGFLDIADKHVMIPVDDVNLVAVDDRTYAILTRFNEEDLESMEGVDEGFWD